MATAKACLVGLGLLVLSSSAQAQTCPGKARRGQITRRSKIGTFTCGEGDGPYGVAPDIPGRVLAADYDCGGAGTAYYDTTPDNLGNAYRLDEGVDVAEVENGDEYAVGWTAAGERLRFTVTVPTNVPLFDFVFKVASPQLVTNAFRIVTGGEGCADYTTDLSGLVSVDATLSSYDFTEQPRRGQGTGGLPAGTSEIWLCFENEGTAIIHFDMAASTTTPPSGPWSGFPPDIPGEIQAEEFDYGGQDVGYYDTTLVNLGETPIDAVLSDGGVGEGLVGTSSNNMRQEFRPEEGVDIYGVDDGYAVGYIEEDEYLAFTVNVAETVVAFDFSFQVSSHAGVLDAFSVVAGGTGCSNYTINLSGLVPVPATGDAFTFEEVEVSDGGSGGLTEGVTQIWMCMNGDGFAVDSFTMTATELPLDGYPFEGIPAVVPGLIQAEKFDDGGQGVAYYDTTSGNEGSVYRPNEHVDISAWMSGYLVDTIAAGEYLRFFVDVSEAVDTFHFIFTTSAPVGVADAFRVVSGEGGCDDYTTDLSGPVTVPGSGDGEITIFSQIGVGGLPVGYAYVWLCFDAGGFAIDSFTMLDEGDSARKRATNTRKKATNTRVKAANTRKRTTNNGRKVANIQKKATNTRKKATNTRMKAAKGPNKGVVASTKGGHRGGKAKCS